MDEGGPFKLVGGPSEIDGRWVAEFEKDGNRISRYLTDKGNSDLLRFTEAGKWEFSLSELGEFSTPPDYKELEKRRQEEAGG